MCMPAMKLPRPSMSCGSRASAAHASSSGESRLAVRSPIASSIAAATVSPGAADTGAADTAAVCVRPGTVGTADAWVKPGWRSARAGRPRDSCGDAAARSGAVRVFLHVVFPAFPAVLAIGAHTWQHGAGQNTVHCWLPDLAPGRGATAEPGGRQHPRQHKAPDQVAKARR